MFDIGQFLTPTIIPPFSKLIPSPYRVEGAYLQRWVSEKVPTRQAAIPSQGNRQAGTQPHTHLRAIQIRNECFWTVVRSQSMRKKIHTCRQRTWKLVLPVAQDSNHYLFTLNKLVVTQACPTTSIHTIILMKTNVMFCYMEKRADCT